MEEIRKISDNKLIDGGAPILIIIRINQSIENVGDIKIILLFK